MKIEECDVIQDLLPSYNDKLLSETSKKLVEEHLKKCKNCSDALKNMNKEIDTSTLFNQDKQIDYLKGYRRKKILTVICAVIITILVLVEGFIVTANILMKMRFLVDVNEINIQGWQIDDTIGFYMQNEKYIMLYDVVEDEENKATIVKILGRIDINMNVGATQVCYVDIDENVEKIYIEDKEGKQKEVWNKEEGFLVEDITALQIRRKNEYEEARDKISKELQEMYAENK